VLFFLFLRIINGKNSAHRINGAGSEQTPYYDPRHSLFFAWKKSSGIGTTLSNKPDQQSKREHGYLVIKDGHGQLRANSKPELN